MGNQRMRHLKTPAGTVHSLRFSPDGRSIYLLSDQPEVRGGRYQHAYKVDASSGIILESWPFTPCDQAIFSPDLRSIYSSDSGDWMCHLRRLNLISRQETELLRTDDLFVTNIAFTPNQHLLAFSVLEGDGVKHFSVRRLDVLGGVLHGAMLDPIRTVALCMAYSPDGRLLATGSPLSELSPSTGIRLWQGRQLIQEFPDPARYLAWSPDGQLAWGAGERLYIAEPGTGGTSRALDGFSGELWALAFSPDSRVIVTGSQSGFCCAHESATGRLVASFDWGIGPIHSVAFSPDGLTCVAGGENGQVVVWDVDN
ncbi:MAG: hypothetical protein C0467_29240 [Planctomycetaceae bacterium]|nr:hypothetical protein [Planctomycetaceae bacterium]